MGTVNKPHLPNICEVLADRISPRRVILGLHVIPAEGWHRRRIRKKLGAQEPNSQWMQHLL
jgi:hypothetical protein